MAEANDSIKERILSAVQERVSREGYARLSVDELTTSIGMSKKTFYKVFESKEEMIGQFVDRTIGEIGGTLDRIVTEDAGFIQKMNSLMAFVGTLSQKINSLLAGDIQRQMPALWKRVEEFRRGKIQENLSRLIAQGMKEGYVQANLNQRVFILVYAASIQAVIQPSILSQESFSAKEAIQQIVQMFFAGIMTDEGRRIFDQQKNHASNQ
jgi:AcrR family transcriptional regulator